MEIGPRADFGERVRRIALAIGRRLFNEMLADFAQHLATEGPHQMRELRTHAYTWVSQNIDRVPAAVRGRIYDIADMLMSVYHSAGALDGTYDDDFDYEGFRRDTMEEARRAFRDLDNFSWEFDPNGRPFGNLPWFEYLV